MLSWREQDLVLWKVKCSVVCGSSLSSELTYTKLADINIFLIQNRPRGRADMKYIQ